MTKSHVPCSDRSHLPCRRRGHEMVSLKVGNGDESEVLEVPLRELRNTSEYFHDQLHGFTEFFVVPNSSCQLFRVYNEFLKTGDLYDPDSDDKTDRRFSFDKLIDIFKFANDFEILSLRNAALDEFFLRIYENPDCLPYQYINSIYEITSSNSSLRHVVVDIIVKIGLKRDMQEWKDKLPQDFMTDCLTAASEDGIVPFFRDLSQDGILDWLRDLKTKVCEVFHVHDFERESEAFHVYDFERDDGVQTAAEMWSKRKEKVAIKREASVKKEAEEHEAAEQDAEEMNAEEMDLEGQRISDEQTVEGMGYLMASLPIRQRY